MGQWAYSKHTGVHEIPWTSWTLVGNTGQLSALIAHPCALTGYTCDNNPVHA